MCVFFSLQRTAITEIRVDVGDDEFWNLAAPKHYLIRIL